MPQTQSLLTRLNGKTFTVVAIVVCLVFCSYLFGMSSKTDSLLMPGQKVTRAELEAEVSVLNARIKERASCLDRQDSIKRLITDQASLFTATGTVNPIGFVNSLISVLAVGYAVDTKRKANLAAKIPTTTPNV